MDTEYLYDGVKYAVGAPFGGAAFLLWDTEKGTALDYNDPDAKLVTAAGGVVTRKSGDTITYKAPATAGEDEFTLCFNDGVGTVLVKVSVVIE